jgi:A/G-specific adenine glycosylase
MLQQTQVKTVLPYWERWLRKLPTIQALAAADSRIIHKLWEGLGYYTRVRNLQKAARIIVKQHAGRFPETFEEVLALPGIGRYTAGAICSIAFNQPMPILDGNVTRVLTRIFGIPGNPRERQTSALLWRLAEDLVTQASHVARHASRLAPRAIAQPSRTRTKDEDECGRQCSCSQLNQSLMELGALICTPRQPQCGICPVSRDCVAYREDRADELPNLGPRVAAIRKRCVACIVKRNGRFLVRQRPAGVVNAHLWEFPNVEITTSSSQAAMNCTPLCRIRHSITRYRITLQAYVVDGLAARKFARRKGRWATMTELKRLPFTAAHRKIVAALADSR